MRWLVTDSNELTLNLQVFRPGHQTPVIEAPWETAHREVAKLWKQEFDTPKPTPPPRPPYTRQQDQAAAALEKRVQTEGLNKTQKQQMLQMIGKALQPLTEEYQQQKLTMNNMQEQNNRAEAELASDIKETKFFLQQMAKLMQQQFMLPASLPVPATAPSTITADLGRQADVGTSIAAQADVGTSIAAQADVGTSIAAQADITPAIELTAQSANLGQGLHLEL